VSCFCGHIHTSFAEALACSKRLQGAGSPRPGNNTQTSGVRSVSAHQNSGLKAIGLLAIHFPEKFHLEAWQALTAESAQREVGLPAGPIMLARQCFDDLPPDVKAALRGDLPP